MSENYLKNHFDDLKNTQTSLKSVWTTVTAPTKTRRISLCFFAKNQPEFVTEPNKKRYTFQKSITLNLFGMTTNTTLAP